MQFGNQIQIVYRIKKPKDPEGPHKECGEPEPFGYKETKPWDSDPDSLTCHGLNQRLRDWKLVGTKWILSS